MRKIQDLSNLETALSEAKSEEEKDEVWSSLETPFIEKIPGDSKNLLITFLYRMENSHSADKPKIYLYSSIIPLFSEQSRLTAIPNIRHLIPETGITKQPTNNL